MTSGTPTVTSNSPASDNPAAISAQQWKWSALAGMASYLDAGSIVALGAGLALFQKEFQLTDGAVGLLAAIGPNAIGCAVGALLGGWLGLALASFGLLGIRIVFLHLFAVAIVTWALRQGLAESARWQHAARTTSAVRRQVSALFSGANLRALVWTAVIYTFWNLAAGT